MGGSRHIEVLSLEDRTPHKWIIPLTEDCFHGFVTKGNNINNNNNNNVVISKVFGEGSLFSPMLFGKFFDPSDAFPLWDFEADVLLSNLRANGFNQVDWLQTDRDFVFKSDLPGVGEECVQVCVEKGRILEISGQYRKQQQQHQNSSNDPKARDWKSGHWWEHGFVRRIELPENADWRKTEVTLKNEIVLEIKIPAIKSPPHHHAGSPTHSAGSSD